MRMPLGRVLLAGAVWGTALSAQAEPARVVIRWSAPSTCPDDPQSLKAIEDFLGERLSSVPAQALAIDVELQGDLQAGYRATLSFAGAQDSTERKLEHPDCSKLTEAAALLVALAIDPDKVKATQQLAAPGASHPEPILAPPQPAPVAIVEPERPPEPADRTEPAAARRAQPARWRPRPAIAILGLASSGPLPELAPGVGLEIALRFGWFEGGLAGRYLASRDASVPEYPGSSIELSLWTAGLRACALPERDQWLLLVCARGDLGSMSGSGQGIDDAHTQQGLFGALGGSVAIGYAAGRLRPSVGLEPVWIAARPRFGVSTDQEGVEVFQPRKWALTGFIGLAYEL